AAGVLLLFVKLDIGLDPPLRIDPGGGLSRPAVPGVSEEVGFRLRDQVLRLGPSLGRHAPTILGGADPGISAVRRPLSPEPATAAAAAQSRAWSSAGCEGRRRVRPP